MDRPLTDLGKFVWFDTRPLGTTTMDTQTNIKQSNKESRIGRSDGIVKDCGCKSFQVCDDCMDCDGIDDSIELEDLEDPVTSGEIEEAAAIITNHFNEEQDRLIFEASKQKAEAIVFTNDFDYDDLGGEFEYDLSARMKYVICDDLIEAKGAISLIDGYCRTHIIPAAFHRIAEEATDVHDFEERLEREFKRL